MRFLKHLIASLLLIAGISPAIAQQYQTLPPNSFVGNNSNRSNPGSALSFNELLSILNLYSLTKIGNADYQISGADRVVATDSQNPAWDVHTWKLPRAVDFNPGQPLYVADLGSKVSTAKPLTIAPNPNAGNDTINGSVSPVSINAANGAFVFISDGYSNWLAQSLVSSSFMPDGTIKSNISGSSSTPNDNSISAVLDKLFGTTQGSVVYRGASSWSALGPGTNGQLLASGGPGANPSFITASGTGTVTSVGCGSGLSGGTITAAGTCAIASGGELGSAFASYATNASLSTTIPADDTIPQITEGTQILSVSYTPVVSTSKLRIDFQGQVSSAGASGDNVTCAIFNGGTNAVAANMVNITATNFKEMITVKAVYSPGSTSAQAITVRCGGATASIVLNGNTSTRLLGGAATATLEVREIQ